MLAYLWLGWLLAAVSMALLWFVQWGARDAGIVDVGWAGGLGLLALFYAYAVPGYPPRKALVALLAGAWAFRLAVYLLFNRVIGKPEDGRYRALRALWGKRAHFYFFLFFQGQALLCALLSLPFLIVMKNPHPALSTEEWLGAIVWIAAVAGESMADAQLAAFRAMPQNKGKTCRLGLWRYSRHPNYFFEWLHWWSYVAMGLRAPYGWATLWGPAVMLIFLYKVTGIPATEAHALASRGEDYRLYRETTSAFIPWFPREKSS